MSKDVYGTPLERLRREVGELRTRLLEIDRIVADLEIPRETDETHPAPPSPMGLEGAAQAVRSLAQGGDQMEILARLLEEAARYSDTAVVFLAAEGGGFRAWRTQGAAHEGWERTSIPPGDPILESVRDQRILEFDLEAGEIPDCLAGLNGPGRAALFPLSFGSRTPLLLFTQGVPEPRIDSVELLVEMARLVLQNQYLSQLAQAEDQGGSTPSRWPTLEALSSEGDRERETAPTEAASLAGPPAATEPTESRAGATASELQPGEAEAPPLEPHTAATGETESPDQKSPAQEGSQPAPEGESAWQVDSEIALEPADLGLSQDEFDRLMGQASTDWLRVQKARRQEHSETSEKPPEEATRPESTPQVDEPEGMPPPEIQKQTAPAEEGSQERAVAEPFPEETEEKLIPTGDSAGREEPASVPSDETMTEVSDVASAIEQPEFPRQAEAEQPGQGEAEVVAEPEEVGSPEEVLHGEAHRFARLLVAEIKLYNEAEVEEGRKNGDLYTRLKTDIDRSREMYEKRVHSSVKASSDYFHAQLIQVLAQDDEKLMGEGYPGPQVAKNA